MIHWISPYSIEKNIGKAYNEQISYIPDDAWIGITDYDFMFLLPDTKRLIWDVVSQGEFDVYGCMTNRLSGTHQLYQSILNDNDMVRDHIDIARSLAEQHGTTTTQTTDNIAGCCMIFRKSEWLKHDGFTENTVTFDLDFTDAVMQSGGKLGIMQGVYGFHCYRLESVDPRNAYHHLFK